MANNHWDKLSTSFNTHVKAKNSVVADNIEILWPLLFKLLKRHKKAPTKLVILKTSKALCLSVQVVCFNVYRDSFFRDISCLFFPSNSLTVTFRPSQSGPTTVSRSETN